MSDQVDDDTSILSQTKVTNAWLRFIYYVTNYIPHGEITIKIVNGEPTERVSEKLKIRFDKAGSIPQRHIEINTIKG